MQAQHSSIAPQKNLIISHTSYTLHTLYDTLQECIILEAHPNRMRACCAICDMLNYINRYANMQVDYFQCELCITLTFNDKFLTNTSCFACNECHFLCMFIIDTHEGSDLLSLTGCSIQHPASCTFLICIAY